MDKKDELKEKLAAAEVPGTTCNIPCPRQGCTGRCGIQPRGHSGPHTGSCGHSWS
jgi:hypothetical protein